MTDTVSASSGGMGKPRSPRDYGSTAHYHIPTTAALQGLQAARVPDLTARLNRLMPHPERHIDPTHHPRWTRGEAAQVGDGLKIFANAVEYFA